MFLRSIIVGLATTLLLVSLLAISRALNTPKSKIIALTEVEVIDLEEPPPPPDLSEPEEPEDLPPPPTPKIEFPNALDDLDAPEIALSLNRIDLTTPIEAFHTDSAPAKMPTIQKPKPAPKKTTPKLKPKPKKTYPTKPQKRPSPPKPQPTKAYYSAGELDSKPRVIRTGKFRWPSGAKGTRGTVTLLLEINESGRVRVISVVSSTNSALNTAAKRVASGSKFTAPRKNGQKVKTRFYKPYVLQKP